MTDSSSLPYPPDAAELMPRILRLRSHFKVILPENIATLKKQIHESNLSGKGGGFNDADWFYNAGNVIAHAARPITMGELSRGLDVPLSTATRIMDWLVKNGYGQRLPDPQDRRIVRVELTEAGKKTYQAIHEFVRGRIEQALSQFTPEERTTFISLLNKVLTTLEKNT
jgi:DNA-binding MarR family transcriptional regulator